MVRLGPYTTNPNYPRWVQRLERMPAGKAVVFSLSVTFLVAAGLHTLQLNTSETAPSMTREWEEANKKFMRFQNNNPIFGESSKK